MTKRRVTITLDEDVYEAISRAVDERRVESVSAYLNEIAAKQADHDRRMAALDALLAEYEAEHGAFTEDELARQAQADRDAAAAVRARRPHPRR